MDWARWRLVLVFCWDNWHTRRLRQVGPGRCGDRRYVSQACSVSLWLRRVRSVWSLELVSGLEVVVVDWVRNGDFGLSGVVVLVLWRWFWVRNGDLGLCLCSVVLVVRVVRGCKDGKWFGVDGGGLLVVVVMTSPYGSLSKFEIEGEETVEVREGESVDKGGYLYRVNFTDTS